MMHGHYNQLLWFYFRYLQPTCDICRLFYLLRKMNSPGIRCIYWKGCWLLNDHSVEKVEIYYSLYYLGKMNIIDVHNSWKRHYENQYNFGYDFIIIFFVTRDCRKRVNFIIDKFCLLSANIKIKRYWLKCEMWNVKEGK